MKYSYSLSGGDSNEKIDATLKYLSSMTTSTATDLLSLATNGNKYPPTSIFKIQITSFYFDEDFTW